jgi:cation transport regulator
VPYASTDDLPFSIRAHLPEQAQVIYLSAFNHAWSEYRDREPERLEEIAHRVAWSAVKRKYQKSGAEWVALDPDGYTN